MCIFSRFDTHRTWFVHMTSHVYSSSARSLVAIPAPHDVAARRSFVMSGALQKILELQPEPGAQLGDMIRAITACYPKEIVDYYSPQYSKQLLDQLDATEIGAQ